MVNNGKNKKKISNKYGSKGKDKAIVRPNSTTHALKHNGGIIKEDISLYSCKTGRQKTNYPKYLKDKNSVVETSCSVILVIEINLSTSAI